MQHHPFQRPARALASVRATPLRLRQQPAALQKRLGPGVAPGEPVLAEQVLVEVLRREPSVARDTAVPPPPASRPEPPGPTGGPIGGPSGRLPQPPRTAGSSDGMSARSCPATPPPPTGSALRPPSGSTRLEASASSDPAVAPSAASHPPKSEILPDRSRTTWTGHFMCWLHPC